MSNPILELLCQRVSSPRLTEPAPDKQALNLIYKSALRAPDHMMLRPWRYLVIEGDARNKLSDIFLRAAEAKALSLGEPLSDFKVDKLKSMTHRAPMIIVAIASLVEHPKVPEQEQLLSCGVGVGYMLLALQAQGFGGIWRTGDLAFDQHVYQDLGLAENESIVGFLYLGTPAGELKSVPELNPDDFFRVWQ
ncbi:MAG: nitroreductase family protein [Oleiphilus sp.]